jgi:hypothetical protein
VCASGVATITGSVLTPHIRSIAKAFGSTPPRKIERFFRSTEKTNYANYTLFVDKTRKCTGIVHKIRFKEGLRDLDNVDLDPDPALNAFGTKFFQHEISNTKMELTRIYQLNVKNRHFYDLFLFTVYVFILYSMYLLQKKFVDVYCL